MRGARFDLDFRRRQSAPWRWLGWALLAAAVGVAIVFSEHHAQVEQLHAAAQGRAHLLKERFRGNVSRNRASSMDPQDQVSVKRANAIIDQLTVPWGDLFDAIQTADARDLVVLSLTPNARDRSVRLVGEARSIDELLAYVERLAAQPALSQVHLLGYNSVQRDGVNAFSFTLAATWRQSP
jgi:Tfp pilus assembly protein PilN